MSAVVFSRTKLCSHRKFQVFEIQVLVQQLLRLYQLFMKSGPDHPNSSFVLSSEALTFVPVIESVFQKFIRDIMCFSP